MDAQKLKIRLHNHKISKKVITGGQTKSQANIKKYFEGKERTKDSERESQNK
jgi:hypothetical protein